MTSGLVQFSVLMPVHASTPAPYFEQALHSILTQDEPATEVIIVEDGPLSPAHEHVLSEAEQAIAERLVRVRLERQVGIADALQAGLARASHAWVARMDADDVARPDRFAKQAALAATDTVDVIGSAMTEFESSPDLPLGERRMPTAHGAIARRMRSTNPINHPTAFMRRSVVLSAGGYRPLPGLEDYDLWARMLVSGARFTNLEAPLVAYRVTPSLFRRRRGRELLAAELRLQRNLMHYGLVRWPRAILNSSARICYRLLPTRLMRAAYRRLFRSTPSASAG